MHRFVVTVAILVAVSTPALAQPPAPLAQQRGDIDGDGKTDEVRIGRGGDIQVLFAGEKTAKVFKFNVVSGAAKATATITARGKEARILVTAEDRAGAGEALWLRAKGRRVSELWRGTVGIDDEDTGTRRVVEAIGGELHRYYVNPAVSRCDGKPARLDTERLSAGKLVAASPPAGLSPAAKTIATTRSPSPEASAASANFFDPGLPSTARGTMSPDLLGSAVTLGDNDPRTAWVEARPGAGKGELVSFRAKQARSILMIRIIAGSARNAAAHKVHNRPRRIGLVFDSGDQYWVELEDAPMGVPQYVALPRPIQARCVTLILDSVYPTKNDKNDRGQTALSEVSVLTTLDLTPGGIEAALVEQALAGGADGLTARRKLARIGMPAVTAIRGRLAKGDLDARAMLGLRRILADIGAAPDELARGLGQRSATSKDRDKLAAALTKLGTKAVPALKALVADGQAARAGRRRAARILGVVPGEPTLAALLGLSTSLAGRDSERRVRAEVSRSLGAASDEALPKLIAAAAAASGNVAADLHRAIGLMARRSKDPAVIAEAARALGAAVNPTITYEQRYRLIAALAALPDNDAVAVVSTWLDKARPSRRAQDIAIRRIATRGLGKNSAPRATEALVAAIKDDDAGVREAAVSALAQRIDFTPGDKPLAERLTADAWPSVRRGAAGALAARCSRQAPRDALRAAVATENDVRVGQVVLTAVVNCGGKGTAELLVAVAKSSKRPTGLRAHAVQLLGQVGGAAITQTLIDLFEGFVRDAFSESSAITLAQAAAGGLCRAGDKAAIAPLADAAENSAYPEIQAAAVRALGCYCDPGTADLLRRLTLHSNAAVSIAAKRSQERCRR